MTNLPESLAPDAARRVVNPESLGFDTTDDVEPLTTLESKRHWIGRAVAEGWLLGFEHDPSVAWGTASASDRPGRAELIDVAEDPVNPIDLQEDA